MRTRKRREPLASFTFRVDVAAVCVYLYPVDEATTLLRHEKTGQGNLPRLLDKKGNPLIPSRPAEDSDIPLDDNGTPKKVLVSFAYDASYANPIGSGWRRPKKIKGKWCAVKWGQRPLLVRTDKDPMTKFLVSV